MRNSHISAATFALMLFASSASAQSPQIVTGCFQTVTENAVLAADVDCTGSPVTALILKPGATLDLAGFTLTAGNTNGVSCESDCTIEGSGGRIKGAGDCGVRIAKGTAIVRDVTLDQNRYGACSATTDDYRLLANVVLENATVTHNRWGVYAKNVTAYACTLSENEIDAVRCGRRCDIRYSIIRHNGIRGATTNGAGRISLVNSEVSFNGGYGVEHAKTIELIDSVVSWNWTVGAHGRRVKVQGTILEQNDQAPECGIDAVCADVIAQTRPKFTGVYCERSALSVPKKGIGYPQELIPWGMCSLD